MNALFSNIVHKVHTRKLDNLQRKTKRLDRANREHLKNVMNSGGISSGSRNFNNNDLATTDDRDDDYRNNIIIDDRYDYYNNNNYEKKDGIMFVDTGTKPRLHSYDSNNSSSPPMMIDEEDFIKLKGDINTAILRHEELECRRMFLQTRLDVYESKIRLLEKQLVINIKNKNSDEEEQRGNVHQIDTDDSDIDEDDDGDDDEELYDYNYYLSTMKSDVSERVLSMKTKIENYRSSLQPVKDIYEQIVDELKTNQSKLDSMELRQLELELKKDECNVVMNELLITEELDPNDEAVHFINNDVMTVDDSSNNDSHYYDSNDSTVTSNNENTFNNDDGEYKKEPSSEHHELI